MNMIVGDSQMDGATFAAPAALVEAIEPEFPAYELRVFVREVGGAGKWVRFISDGVPVEAGARLVDKSFFDTQIEADRAAAACDDLLTQSGWPPDETGWHAVPSHQPTLIPNLLRVARQTAWSEAADAVAVIPMLEPLVEPPPLAGPAEPLARAPRKWPLEKHSLFCCLVGQGYSAKQVANHPEIRSTENACYQRARQCGLSFREVPTGSISLRLPIQLLLRFERVAAQSGRTRDALIESWLRRVANDDPVRFGLVAI